MALGSPELARKREAVVRAHIEAENRHDPAGVVATFHHPKYEVMPMGANLDGPQAVSEFLSGVFHGFPDFTAHVSSLTHAENGIVVESHYRDTQAGVVRYSTRRTQRRRAILCDLRFRRGTAAQRASVF